jgi:hypothetical protein
VPRVRIVEELIGGEHGWIAVIEQTSIVGSSWSGLPFGAEPAKQVTELRALLRAAHRPFELLDQFAKGVGGHLRPDRISPVGQRSKRPFVEGCGASLLARERLQYLLRSTIQSRKTEIRWIVRWLRQPG